MSIVKMRYAQLLALLSDGQAGDSVLLLKTRASFTSYIGIIYFTLKSRGL